MLFLTDFTSQIETLTEQTESGKVVYMEGTMIMTERENRNGRIYSKGMMEKVVDKYVKEYVSERRAIGELNHPARPFADPKEAAVIIESLTWQGNDVIGKARVLNNPNGTIIKSLLEAKFKMGMSTRGLGDVRERSGKKFVENYMLNAIDAVDMPSGQNCYVNAMNESTEWVNESGIWIQKVQQEKALNLFLEKFEQLIKDIKRNK